MCTKNNLLGFASGLGCGIGIALLLAPKSGDQTRTLIVNGKEQLRRQATGLVNKGQEELQRRKEGLKHAVEAGVQAYQSHVA